MKVDIKNLFSDKKGFPDEMEITLGNGATVTLADLRAYNTQTGGQLEAEFKTKQKGLAAEQARVQAATERLAHIITELQQGRLPEDAAELGIKLPARSSKKDDRASAADDDILNDPYLKPLLTRLDQLQTAMTDLREKELNPLKKSVGQASLSFINREAQRMYEGLPLDQLKDENGSIPEDLSLSNLLKYAVENNRLTQDRLPDVKKAFNDIAGDRLVERRMKEAEERGYKKRDAELASQAFPVPGAGHPGSLNAPKGPKPIDTKGKRAEQIMSEALGQAAKDTDMWRGIYGVSAEA